MPCGKLHIIEVTPPAGQPNKYVKKTIDFEFTDDAPGDFPISMQSSSKFGAIYLITKFGYLHIFDIESGLSLYTCRISNDAVFISTQTLSDSGMMAVSKSGQVFSVALNEETIVKYLRQGTLIGREDLEPLAFSIASRCNLPGLDDIFINRFLNLYQAGNYTEAAKVAATAPCGILRTTETIQQFLQPTQGATQPVDGVAPSSALLKYFAILLEKGEKLNKHESIALCRPVVQQQKKPLIEKWLKEDKIELSEELGDLIRTLDIQLALAVYVRAAVSNKVFFFLFFFNIFKLYHFNFV
jgi:clathrin heavy chain